MENTPQFSVIMPVYNVEKHLKDAVGSVISQTYGNFELILVDDCSPDNSPAICDELVALDERIKVIHLEKNGGLSNARNNGISKACGEYVFFMDSDDIIEDYLFQDVYTSLEKNKADVVAFGLKENYYDAHNNLSDTFEIAFPKELLLNNTIDVRKEVIHLEEKTLYGYACTKFYRNKKLQSSPVRFENITLIEDIKFNVNFFQDITSLNILNITPYNYQKRIDGSLTNKFVKYYFELHRERVKLVFDQYI
ncbi:MAG: glycosyltransferase family 2 protein, partial [Oscillospiraceae bacterium]